MTDLNKVNFMSKTRFDNLAVTNADELYLVETDLAIDSEVVHNTGAETIAGNKTFSNNLTVTGTTTLNNALTVNNIETINGNLNVYTATPSNSTSASIFIHNINTTSGSDSFRDIQGIGTDTVRVGGIRFFHSSDDKHKVIIYTADNSNNYSTDLSVNYDNTNSIGYIETNTKPSASSSTSSKIIPTIGWINDTTTATNLVHRGSSETISGQKTFSSTPIVKNSNDIGYATKFDNANNSSETQSAQTVGYYRALDVNNKIIGDFRIQRSTLGTSTSMMIARNYASDSEGVSCTISCMVDNEGNVYTSAPTPAVTDNSTQIATTAYVNAKIQFVNALPASPVNGVLYLIPET